MKVSILHSVPLWQRQFKTFSGLLRLLVAAQAVLVQFHELESDCKLRLEHTSRSLSSSTHRAERKWSKVCSQNLLSLHVHQQEWKHKLLCYRTLPICKLCPKRFFSTTLWGGGHNYLGCCLMLSFRTITMKWCAKKMGPIPATTIHQPMWWKTGLQKMSLYVENVTNDGGVGTKCEKFRESSRNVITKCVRKAPSMHISRGDVMLGRHDTSFCCYCSMGARNKPSWMYQTHHDDA